MDTPQALESSQPQSEPAQVWDQDMFVISDNNMGDFPFARNQQGHLFLCLK